MPAVYLKNSLKVIGLIILMSSCSHKIVRTGYEVNKSDYAECEVNIIKFKSFDGNVEKLGDIKIGETGFSTACSEAHAIEILKNEACALNADLINIIEESRPDAWSSCYRCTAEFIKADSSLQIAESEYYQPEIVDERVEKDRKQNTALVIVSIVVGFSIGFFLL